MRKDKEKEIGEPMTDEQVAVFLNARPYNSDESADYHLLVRAYRGLRIEDFERFLVMFKAEGFDLNAVNGEGRTFAETVREHAQGEEYVAVLEAAGAR